MTVAGQEEIPKTQRAAVSDDASGFEIREIPVTQPDQLEPGRALVKVLYTGVCHVSISLLCSAAQRSLSMRRRVAVSDSSSADFLSHSALPASPNPSLRLGCLRASSIRSR